MKFLSTNKQQTFNFAKKMAKNLKDGEVIGLIGELGAGKTIFTKGLAAGLGIKKNITSPTFVLMKIYRISNRKSARADRQQIANLVHVDAYRIKSTRELSNIGINEYLDRSNAIVIIEWADKIKKILPSKTRYIIIKNKGEKTRLLIY